MSSSPRSKAGHRGASLSPGMLGSATIKDLLIDTSIAASERAALGLPSNGGGLINNIDGRWKRRRSHSTHTADNLTSILSDTNDNPGSEQPQSPPQFVAYTPHIRTEAEKQIERNERLDEVEPGLTEFRKQRKLHVDQFENLQKQSGMVSNRIDKLNDEIEDLRLQWGKVEREKAGLLGSMERYEQKSIELEKVVRKDDAIAKKYHNYLTLVEEVLVLEDSDDEGEDEYHPMYVSAQGYVEGEHDE
ncbi:hypothetical protein Q7P37_007710 [Cladosporium fusiforme]